jgi:hypothetical protein
MKLCRRDYYSPSIKLSRRQHDDPIMPCRITLDELVEDVAAQRTRTEHGEEF